MPKRDTTQEALDRLTELEGEGASESGLAELRKHLAHRVNHVAGRAAEVVQVWGARELMPELEAAFDRFMENPVKTDPMCAAKLPIVKCLQELDYGSPELMLRGARHVQMEPVWAAPGVEDTAPGLRGACGRALAVMAYPEANFELARLVMDPEAEARRSAVDTLGWLGGTDAELVLRTKVLAGDEEPDITSACFHALMGVNPGRSLEFVAEYLEASPQISEGAALALGESKHPEAWPHLLAAWERAELEVDRQSLLLPLALHRSDESFDVLVDVVRTARWETAAVAVKVSAVMAGDGRRREMLEQAVGGRTEPEVRAAFDAEWGG